MAKRRIFAVVGLLVIVGLVVIGLSWLASLQRAKRQHAVVEHQYFAKSAPLPVSVGTEIELAVNETGHAPPPETTACIRWLVAVNPKIMRRMRGLDEEAGMIYDSLGNPLQMSFHGNSVAISIAGVDGVPGTDDDITHVVDFGPYLHER